MTDQDTLEYKACEHGIPCGACDNCIKAQEHYYRTGETTEDRARKAREELVALEALIQFEDDAEEAGRLHADDRRTCRRCRIIVGPEHRHPVVLYLTA